RHTVGARVSHSQVGFAVTVEVADCYGSRIVSHAVFNQKPEGAIAPAQQYPDTADGMAWGRAVIGRSQVRHAIPVEIIHRDRVKAGDQNGLAYRHEVRRRTTIGDQRVVSR